MACDEGSEYIERAFIQMLLGTRPNSNKEVCHFSSHDLLQQWLFINCDIALSLQTYVIETSTFLIKVNSY